MHKILGFCCILALLFAASFWAARLPNLKEKEKGLASLPLSIKNKPFVIVVSAYNNGANAAKMIASIASQNYHPFRVVYIDDASTDGSFDLARDLLYDSGVALTLVRNQEHVGDLANVFHAASACEEEEIMVVLRGEDWFAHEWVLERLNRYFANPDLWLACSRYCEFPTYEWNRDKQIDSCGLQSFYASLFKKIPEKDLRVGGKFLPACGVLAYMRCMWDMAGEHAQFLNEVHTVSEGVVKQEDLELQERCSMHIQALNQLPRITTLQVNPCGD